MEEVSELMMKCRKKDDCSDSASVCLDGDITHIVRHSKNHKNIKIKQGLRL
jgi:hypothetical protein